MLQNLRDYEGHIHDRRYAGERCFPECVIKRHSGLTTRVMVRVRFRIMDNPNCYELRIISIATGKFVKCYNPKPFPSLNEFLELSFGRIIHAHMSQRLLETSFQPNTCNFFLDLHIRRIRRLLSTCGIWLVGISLVVSLLQLQKTNVCCAHKQYGILFHE
ncbi:transposable element Tcb1 transposase [Trichonephila clavipes]|uniref:Transposable element Tcb1 transposase n=1 Tax=Trichonephila clavipes TaxID=2585209 RepID=A0A8X6SJW6_TRICX|nr:transposable element Tcb1 transposase [Trichonephila clavipes]